MIKATKLSFKNKIIPKRIEQQVQMALSHFPDLETTPISFIIKKNTGSSFMKAQPLISSLFKNKRSYRILINEKLGIKNKEIAIEHLPNDVLIGWIGHELGHILDYETRNGLELIWFGIKYIFWQPFTKQAERVADYYALNHQMKRYILATKNYILDDANFSEKYRAKIRKIYVSPEEILNFIEKQS